MDRSRRQRKALQIDPSTAAAGWGSGAEADAGSPAIGPDANQQPRSPRHLVIRLQPRSRGDAVLGERDGAVLIALRAAPVDGAANAALLRFLADRLASPLAALSLVRGAGGRLKWVGLDGLTVAEARRRLLASPESS